MPRLFKNTKANSGISVSFGSRTDVGRVREQNEDSLTVKPPLYVVCDGMGGHEAGEVASEIAVNTILENTPKYPDGTALAQAIEKANSEIFRSAWAGIGRAGMGTTCTAAMLEGERLVIAQVGDSRAYLLHDGNLQQLTRDHSYVADLVEAGEITATEARVHPKRSVITRALGSPYVQPDIYEINVQTNDRLMLCSDGLYSMVEDAAIENILASTQDAQDAADKLVEAALSAGGNDNITVIVVDATGFAEVKRKKIARKTKITAAVVLAALVTILAGAGVALNFMVNNSAYLGEVDGCVAIYKGFPDEVLGQQFSDLQEVTDVRLEDLEAGVANRIRNNEVRDSLGNVYGIVESYREEVTTKGDTPGTSTEGAGEEAAADAADTGAGEEAAVDAAGTSAGEEVAADAAGTSATASAPSSPSTSSASETS